MKKLLSMLCALCALFSTACSSDDDNGYKFEPTVGVCCTRASLEGIYKVTAVDSNNVTNCEFSFINTNDDSFERSYISVKNFPDSRNSERVTQTYYVTDINLWTPIYDANGYKDGYDIHNGLVKCAGDGYVVYFDFSKHDSEGIVIYQDNNRYKFTLHCKKAQLNRD